MNFIDSYVHYNRKHEAPSVYHKWCGIYALSSVVGRRVWLGAKDNAPLFPNLYVGLVGPQGTLRKSTCVQEAHNRVRDIDGLHVMGDAASREAIARLLASFQTPEPKFVEEWTQVLNGAEAAFYLGELSDLLGSALQKDDRLVQWLWSWYDSRPDWRPWKYTTISRWDNPEDLYRLYVCFLFGTTPTYIRDKFPDGCTEQGLGSRVIWVVCTHKDVIRHKGTDWGWDAEEGAVLTRDLKTLREFLDSTSVGEVSFSKDAKYVLNAWEDLWQEKMIVSEHDPINGFLAREPDHLKKVAMLRMLGDPDRRGSLTISADDLTWADDQITALEPGVRGLFKASQMDLTTKVAFQMRDDLEKSYVNVEIEGKSGPLRGAVASEFKQAYVGQVGGRIAYAAYKILLDTWAFESPDRYKVADRKKARQLLLWKDDF